MTSKKAKIDDVEGLMGETATEIDLEEEAAAATRSGTRDVPDDLPSVEGIQFQSHDISSETLGTLFGCFDPSAGNQIVSLEKSLGSLKLADDEFLPDRIYIRDCMKGIFWALEKSVLFFIAALYKAETLERPVVYFRKTREETNISVFVMFRTADGHDAEPDLNAFYEYFCTSSGGHPLLKNAQKDLFLWILDGWTETEVRLFATLLGRTAAESIQAYKVCGGCIRDIISFVDGDSDERAQRLRTMFNGETVSKAIPDAIQIVDSAHVLQILRGRLPMESYFAALLRGKAIKSGTVVGVYFEEILHQWFKESLPREIAKVCVSTGTTSEGVEQLVEKNTYWIPSVPNFPNIDAAVVLGRVLYAFQYTKASNHGFNVDTFWQDFVTVVRRRLEFDRIHVYIVLIDDVSSTLTVNFNKSWTITSGTRASAARVDILCTSSYVNIDTTAVESIRTSASAGFSFT